MYVPSVIQFHNVAKKKREKVAKKHLATVGFEPVTLWLERGIHKTSLAITTTQ